MPDVLGDIYEGILAHCLEVSGCVSVNTSPERPIATCRATCIFTEECKMGGIEPSIDVDPDLLGVDADGTHLVAFVTHWRTTSFNKKFWRTVEEIFEYATHAPDTRGINFIAERMGEADNLRDSLGRLAGNTVDLHKSWNESLDQSVNYFEATLVNLLQPTNPEKVKRHCNDHCDSDLNIKSFVDLVKSGLKKSRPFVAPGVSTTELQSHCMHARRSSSNWEVRDISEFARTSTQLLALVVHAAQLDGVNFSAEDYARGVLRIPKGARATSLRRLSETPYRYQKRQPSFFISARKSLVGTVITFDSKVFPDVARSQETFDLAVRYHRFLSAHPIWSGYLDRFCERGVSDALRVSKISTHTISSILQDAIILKKRSWLLDSILASLEISRVKLGADLDAVFREQFGIPIRKLAPFGDEPKNVIAYCARGESEKLNLIPGKSRDETLSILVELLDSYLQVRLRNDLTVSEAIVAHKIRDMRTFLSGAPHPILGAIDEMLHRLAIVPTHNVTVDTIFTRWFGGNTGRTIYQYGLRIADSDLYLKVSTGQDGNEGHKWKELAGRRRAHRLASEEGAPAWLILDGTWTAASVRKLYEAGYERIFSITEVARLEEAIASVQLGSSSNGMQL